MKSNNQLMSKHGNQNYFEHKLKILKNNLLVNNMSNSFKIELLQDIIDERKQSINVQTCKSKLLLST